MAIHMRWLDKSEVAYGMSCIEQLWKSNHILARDRALFEWQYRHGKTTETLGFLVAENEGKPVGCSGLILLPFHLHGTPIPGGVGAITIVDPAYRKEALGIQMMEEADKNLQVVGSIGINSRVAILYRLQGRYVMDAFPRYICIAHQDACMAYLDQAIYSKKRVLPDLSSCTSLLIPRSIGKFTVTSLDKDALDEWDQAWNRLFAPRMIGVARNAAYLIWRYLEHPIFRYTILIVRDAAHTICGMAVTRLIALPGNISQLRILDFLATNQSSGKALAASIAEMVSWNTAFVEHYALGNHWEPLQSIGMTTQGNKLFSVYTTPPDMEHCTILSSFLVRLSGYTPAKFVNSPEIYLSLADGDQDRPN